MVKEGRGNLWNADKSGLKKGLKTRRNEKSLHCEKTPLREERKAAYKMGSMHIHHLTTYLDFQT